MNNVYVIVTYNEKYKEPEYNLESAAEAWKECGVCAIGWSRLGNLKKVRENKLNKDMQLFLQIEKGDLILAYTGNNTIAYVGEIKDGKYNFTEENKVGNKNEFGYKNQFRVNWWNEPHHFSRYDLPKYICEQLGKRGKTVIKLDLGHWSFDNFKAIVKACAKSGSQLIELNEDMIKAGILKYLKRHFNLIEPGLKIIEAEPQITQENRPDFIAKDNTGKKVIIECKGIAHSDAFDQIKRYEKRYIKEKPRLMLIAFKIAEDCRKVATNSNIELIECDLNFKKLFKKQSKKSNPSSRNFVSLRGRELIEK